MSIENKFVHNIFINKILSMKNMKYLNIDYTLFLNSNNSNIHTIYELL